MDKRVSPHSVEVEQSVLGAILLNDNLFYEVRDLSQDMFYKEVHKLIFGAMKAIRKRKEPIDLITLTEELKSINSLADAGGISYITSLSTVVPTTKNINSYINKLISFKNRRDIIEASSKIMDMAFKEADDITILSNAKDCIGNIGILNSDNFIVDIWDVEDDDDSSTTRVASGFIELDKRLKGGFEFGTLNVLAGWQGAGKSTLINQMVIAESINQGYKTFIYSGELKASNAIKWLRRTIANESHIKEIEGKFGTYYNELDECKVMVKEWLCNKLYLYKNKRNLTIDALIHHMEVLAKKEDVKVFIIDNLVKFIMTIGVSDELMAQTIIVNKLKDFADENNVIVHLVAHCKKNGDRNKAPTIEDISGSANIANLADYVTCIHRVPKNDSNKDKGYDTGLYLYKNRYGSEMHIPMRMNFSEKRKRFYTGERELRKEFKYAQKYEFTQATLENPF